MQNREREAIISVRIVCFYFIIFLSKIGLIRFESVQSRVQAKLGSIMRFKQEPFQSGLYSAVASQHVTDCFKHQHVRLDYCEQ